MVATKRGRKPKYLHTIVLDGVNARELYKRYKQCKKNNSRQASPHFSPIIEYSSKNGDISTTQITELRSKNKPNRIYFDSKNSDHHVTMVDYINYGCLPERTDLWCGHCHHSFTTSPIGIPIRYVRKKPELVQPEDDKIIGTNNYFLTHGIFCSFPCCLAFLKNYGHKSHYKNSKSLLYSLYYKLYQAELNIKPAPDWECLKVHGGELSIEEFRKSFCTCNYIITENIKRPYMVAVGKYIEERRCGYI